jgi:hypothetical protein
LISKEVDHPALLEAIGPGIHGYTYPFSLLNIRRKFYTVSPMSRSKTTGLVLILQEILVKKKAPNHQKATGGFYFGATKN